MYESSVVVVEGVLETDLLSVTSGLVTSVPLETGAGARPAPSLPHVVVGRGGSPVKARAPGDGYTVVVGETEVDKCIPVRVALTIPLW